MTRRELISLIKEKRSFLCVGLDPDLERIPEHIRSAQDPIFEFNKAIIDATRDYCVAYKPNLAFYECLGLEGWTALKKTIDYIGKSHFVIADAKRGDIGNTSKKYAEAFFTALDCDAVTVAPYMGSDSVKPFLAFRNKWVILLALTSNPGANDFQMSTLEDDTILYQSVVQKSMSWGNASNLMYVAGATRPEMLKGLRQLLPESFFLVPGVGAQGGSLREVCKYGLNSDAGLLVNASRSILYAGEGKDFAEAARAEAEQISFEMSDILRKKGVF